MLITKIVKNKALLDGLRFNVTLCNRIYEFKIFFVNENGIKVGIPITFEEMEYVDSNSLEYIVKEVILETSANNQFPLYRQAYLSKHKLKNQEIVVEGNIFKMDLITSSKLTVQKLIDYDELLESENGTFLGTVKEVVLNNLVDNPPKPKTIKSYGYGYGNVPYLFDSFSEPMHFHKLGPRRTFVSDTEVEKNREKYEGQRKKEAENRKKYEELEKKLDSYKKASTRDLARHR